MNKEKIISDKHLFRGVVIQGEKAVCKVLGIDGFTRDHAVLFASQAIGVTLGIGNPTWTKRNISEFQKNGRTRFDSLDFVVPNNLEKNPDFEYFEYMDFEIIEPQG